MTMNRKIMIGGLGGLMAIAVAMVLPLGTQGTVLATAAVSSAPADGYPASGCWVQIWEDENFQDDNDMIVGPGRWNNMRNLPGANESDWGDEIDSLETGPNVATLKVWEDEGYADNSRTFGPNESLNNLRGSPDLGDTIDSMEIACR